MMDIYCHWNRVKKHQIQSASNSAATATDDWCLAQYKVVRAWPRKGAVTPELQLRVGREGRLQLLTVKKMMIMMRIFTSPPECLL